MNHKAFLMSLLKIHGGDAYRDESSHIIHDRDKLKRMEEETCL